ADRAYAQAEAWYHRANDGAGEAEAVQGRGYLFLLREEYARARDVLEQALRKQASADPRSRAVTRLLVGYALREGGDTAGARRVVTTALDTLRVVGDAAGEAAARAWGGAVLGGQVGGVGAARAGGGRPRADRRGVRRERAAARPADARPAGPGSHRLAGRRRRHSAVPGAGSAPEDY